jgi:transglutaminase-like putative cysteine protease
MSSATTAGPLRTPAPRGETSSPPVASAAQHGWMIAAELGLLALALGTAAGFIRMFVGWEFLERLAPALLLGWAVPLVLRRLRANVAIALAVHVAVGIVLLTVQFAPGTHFLGVPSPATLTEIGAAVDASFGEFSELVAPVPASDGFLVAIAAGFWLFAFFADLAAMRYRATVQAAVPYLSVFLTVGILSRETGRMAAAAWFGLGAVVYAVGQRGLTALERRWVDGANQRSGTRAVAAAAGLVLIVAMVAGLLVGPRLPGDDQPVLDLREVGRGGGQRTVVSPFVGIRSLLGQRSEQVVFEVEADAPAYWRLTALEQFDPVRDIWVSSATYTPTRGELPPGSTSPREGTDMRQEFRIRGLGGLWLPAAYVPERIDTDAPVSFDRRSASLILRETAEGPVSYGLVSRVPDFTASGPLSSAGAVPDDGPAYLEVPPMGDVASAAIGRLMSGTTSDYERLLRLQNWFRGQFAYDESVDYSGEAEPLTAFLEQRRGFCQQFSSAFALMARAMGIPSRVAVGFTPGDESTDESTGKERFVVRGRHAHAWPEVHLAGVGWVPFEPTPQRGDPQSVEHTGVAPAQAPPPPPGIDPESEAAATTTAVTESPTTTAQGDTAGRDDPAIPGRTPSEQQQPTRSPVAALVLLASVAALGVLIVGWRARWGRRRGPPRTPDEIRRAEIGSEWSAATRALAGLGLTQAGTETPLEFARRVTDSAEFALLHAAGDASDASDPGEALVHLAHLETRAAFGASSPSPTETDQARAAAAIVRSRVESAGRSGRRRLPVA